MSFVSNYQMKLCWLNKAIEKHTHADFFSFCLCCYYFFKTLPDMRIKSKLGYDVNTKQMELFCLWLIAAILSDVCGEQSEAGAFSQLSSLSGMTLNSGPLWVKEQTPSLVS